MPDAATARGSGSPRPIRGRGRRAPGASEMNRLSETPSALDASRVLVSQVARYAPLPPMGFLVQPGKSGASLAPPSPVSPPWGTDPGSATTALPSIAHPVLRRYARG